MQIRERKNSDPGWKKSYPGHAFRILNTDFCTNFLHQVRTYKKRWQYLEL
jgi:hypothetical protein